MKLPNSGLPLALGLVGLLVAAGIAKEHGLLGSRSLDGDDDGDDASDCPACGGVGAHLGTLGNRLHCRCQDCGMDFSTTVQVTQQVTRGPSADYQRGVRDGLEDERDLEEEP